MSPFLLIKQASAVSLSSSIVVRVVHLSGLFIEYWSSAKYDYEFPKNVAFDSKLDTDLFEFAKNKTLPTGLAFSPDGRKFATICMDRRVRVFNFVTGKLVICICFFYYYFGNK